MELQENSNKHSLGWYVNIVLGVLLLALIVYSGYNFLQNRLAGRETENIHTFEECVSAGYPIMESYPRGCKAGNVTFVEDVATPIEQNPVIVPELEAGGVLVSPLSISGKALGNWFFEASFPVKLLDESGSVIATGLATALSDWMTAGYVPFTVNLEFDEPATATGYVEFTKDNPSGLPENDAFVRFPARFR